METGDVLGRSTADASVRQAVGADAAAMGAVQARAWRSAYAHLLPATVLDRLDAEQLATAWAQAAARPGARQAVLVACAGASVVGFAAVGPCQDPDAGDEDGELTALLVDPAHQRVGHGSRLLAAATDALRASGMTNVRAWTPATDDVRRAFLTSAGLRPDGARRTFAGDGDTAAGITEIRLVAALQAS